RFIELVVTQEFEIILINIALFEILKTEIGAKESRGAILKSDAAIALLGRDPHPLVGSPVGMIDYKKGHSLDVRRGHETQFRLTVSVHPEPVIRPALLADSLAGIDYFERAFIMFGLRLGAVLNFSHYLTRVLWIGRAGVPCE